MFAEVQNAEPGQTSKGSRANVAAGAEIEEQPIELAVFRHQRQTGTDRINFTPEPDRLAVQGEFP